MINKPVKLFYEEIKRVTYFKTGKRKILTVTPKEGKEYAIFIKEHMEESIDDIVERFKYNVEQKDYLPKAKKLYNFVLRTSILIAIAIVLIIIIKSRLNKLKYSKMNEIIKIRK